MSGNSKHLNLGTISPTFMNGGYYRADVSDTLSVLALNTLYFNKKNDATKQGDEAQNQLDWLKSQLENAEDNRKFIITYHIYPGARHHTTGPKTLWNDDQNVSYFNILTEYSDKVILEVGAHDHFSDLRYHEDSFDFSGKSSLKEGKVSKSKSYLHNLIVNPGVSPIDN
jgi:hypothetical protein